jgi:hypothetical protein
MRGIIFIAIAVCTYWILKFCFGKRKGTVQDIPNKYFAIFAGTVFFSFLFGVPYWGNKIPGSIFERRSYSGRYYAIVYEGKQRDVPEKAQVLIESDVDSSFGYDDEIDNSSSQRIYMLKRLYDKYGRSTSFEDQEEELVLNKTVMVLKENKSDGTWKEWGIELLDIPVDK